MLLMALHKNSFSCIKNVRRTFAAMSSATLAGKNTKCQLPSQQFNTSVEDTCVATSSTWVPFPLTFSVVNLPKLAVNPDVSCTVRVPENVAKAAERLGITTSEYQFLRDWATSRGAREHLVKVLRLLKVWKFSNNVLLRRRILKATDSLAETYSGQDALFKNVILRVAFELFELRSTWTVEMEAASHSVLQTDEETAATCVNSSNVADESQKVFSQPPNVVLALSCHEAVSYIMAMNKLQAVHPILFDCAMNTVTQYTREELSKTGNLFDLAMSEERKISFHAVASTLVNCVKLRYSPSTFYALVLKALKKGALLAEDVSFSTFRHVLTHNFHSLTLLLWGFTILQTPGSTEPFFLYLVRKMLEHHKETLVKGSQQAKSLLADDFKMGRQLKQYRVEASVVGQANVPRLTTFRSQKDNGTLHPIFSQLRQITFSLMDAAPEFGASLDPAIVSALTEMSKTHVHDVHCSELQRSLGHLLERELMLPIEKEKSITSDPGLVVDFAVTQFTDTTRHQFLDAAFGARPPAAYRLAELDRFLSSLTIPFKGSLNGVAFESDGVYHYVQNLDYLYNDKKREVNAPVFPRFATYLNGQSAWKDKQLQKYGWQCVRIPYFHTLACRKNPKKIHQLRHKISIDWRLWTRVTDRLRVLREREDALSRREQKKQRS